MTNLAGLTAPISEEDPCGVDMSLSTDFDAIVEARRADDPSLEQGDWVTELKSADWKKVSDLCSKLLTEDTKDIRLCVWLAEAWGNTDGFAGLASAYWLFAQLCSTDWENLHPLPDEDGDEEARINNVARLLHLSVPLMRQLPVTRSGAGAFSASDLQSARHASTHARDDDDDNRGEGASRLAKFETARRDTPNAFYVELLEDLDECSQALKHLEDTLDDKLGSDAPGFTSVHETVNEIHRLVKGFAEDAGVSTKKQTRQDKKSAAAGPAPAAGDGSAAVDEQEAMGAVSAGSAQASAGPIRSRAQALSQLRMVADYFRRTEPHSPVAYMAETAARWGDMPLHAWLRSVIRDDGELSHMEELLGLSRQPRVGASSGGGNDRSDDDASFDGDMYQ